MSLARTGAPQAIASATGQAEPLGLARLEHQRGPSVDRRQCASVPRRGRRERRQRGDAPAIPRRSALDARSGGKAPPTLISRAPGIDSADPGEDVEQDVDPLAGDVRADVEQLGAPGRAARAAGSASASASGSASGEHSGWVPRWTTRTFGLGDDPAIDQASTRRLADQARRRPRLGARAGSAGPWRRNQAGRGSFSRLEQAAEGVEVVAGHDRPACRQDSTSWA